MNVNDLQTQGGRKQIIEMIESKDNLGRKNQSYIQNEIYSDRIKEHVIASLREQFSAQTVIEMPIVSTVNIAKRCVNNIAVIYSKEPERDWTDLNDAQKEILWNVYHDMKANKKLGIANKYYKLHKQCLIQMLPKDGQLIMRVLHPHQWDAIPNAENPEIADGYIISAYDKSDNFADSLQGAPTGNVSISSQNTANYKANAQIREQSKQAQKRFVVWTNEYNFIMDGNGELVTEVLPNPIGALPFIEISEEKEFEYWVRQGSSFTDFTIELNAALSEVRQVSRMQGFAVAIFKGPKEMKPTNMQIGPNYLLHLPQDKDSGIETSFEFASPSSNIEGSIKFIEVMLSGFLTANGIDPKTVSLSGESTQYNSGIDRLLAMIDKMQASSDDYGVFQWVESQVFDLVRLWLNVLSGTETLKSQYSLRIPDTSQIVVEFEEPEMVQTESDKLDYIQKKIDMGIYSPIEAIMELDELSRDDAQLKYDQIQKDLFGSGETTSVIPNGSESGDQSF